MATTSLHGAPIGTGTVIVRPAHSSAPTPGGIPHTAQPTECCVPGTHLIIEKKVTGKCPEPHRLNEGTQVVVVVAPRLVDSVITAINIKIAFIVFLPFIS